LAIYSPLASLSMGHNVEVLQLRVIRLTAVPVLKPD